MKHILFAFLVFFLGCIKNPSTQSASVQQSPTDVVKMFVELSASSKSTEDKKRLIDSCAGDLKRALERMTDEEFKLVYLSSQIKVEKMEILNSDIQGDIATVHYRVSVENKQGTETTQETNEREVQLHKNSNGWVIEGIRLRGTDKVAFTRGMMF